MWYFFCLYITIFIVVQGGEKVDFTKFTNHGNGHSESIYIAALTNDTKYIVDYHQAGNDLYLKDERHQTLLHLATRNKALLSLELLLKLGLNPNEGDKYDDTPLHIASHMGNTEMVELLLRYNADPNYPNSRKETPLHKGCFKGNIEVIKLLIDNKADIYLTDEFHASIMQYVVRSKKIKAVKYLIAQGAIINSLDIRNQSTLHYAALYSTVDIVKLLINEGVNPYSKSNYLLTPLHLAVEHPDFEMVNVFLEFGLTSYDKSKFGLSPYDEAIQKNNYEAVELFNKLKNDMDYQSELKSNALTLSIVRSDFDQADSLIPRSNVNSKDIFGNTALFYAIMNQESYLVEQLIKYDASIYAIDNMNLDALYYAVLVGNKDIVKAIMKKQVNLDKKYHGYTVLEYAKYTEDTEIYNILKNEAI